MSGAIIGSIGRASKHGDKAYENQVEMRVAWVEQNRFPGLEAGFGSKYNQVENNG